MMYLADYVSSAYASMDNIQAILNAINKDPLAGISKDKYPLEKQVFEGFMEQIR